MALPACSSTCDTALSGEAPSQSATSGWPKRRNRPATGSTAIGIIRLRPMRCSTPRIALPRRPVAGAGTASAVMVFPPGGRGPRAYFRGFVMGGRGRASGTQILIPVGAVERRPSTPPASGRRTSAVRCAALRLPGLTLQQRGELVCRRTAASMVSSPQSGTRPYCSASAE